MSNGRKRRRQARVFGYSTAHSGYSEERPWGSPNDLVALMAVVESAEDKGREITLKMTPREARHWAAMLLKTADEVDRLNGNAPEQEQAPAKPSGRLAELLGLTEGESK